MSRIIQMLTGGKWNPLYDLARALLEKFQETGKMTIISDDQAIISDLLVPAITKESFPAKLTAIYDDANYIDRITKLVEKGESFYVIWNSDTISGEKITVRMCAATSEFFRKSPNASVGENKTLQIAFRETWDSSKQSFECQGKLKEEDDWFRRNFIGFVLSPDRNEIWGPWIPKNPGYIYQKKADAEGAEEGTYIIYDMQNTEFVAAIPEPRSSDNADRIHSGLYFGANEIVKEFNVCQSFKVGGVRPSPLTVMGMIVFDAYRTRKVEEVGVVHWSDPFLEACLQEGSINKDKYVYSFMDNELVFELDNKGNNASLNEFAREISKHADADSMFTKLHCLCADEKELSIWKDGEKWDLYTSSDAVTDKNQSCAVHAAAASLYINNSALVSTLGKVFGLYYIYYALVYTDGILVRKPSEKNGDPIVFPSGAAVMSVKDFFANDMKEDTSLFFTICRQPFKELTKKAYYYKLKDKQHYICGRPLDKNGTVQVLYDSTYNIAIGTVLTNMGNPSGDFFVRAGVYDGMTMSIENYGVLAAGTFKIQSSLNNGGRAYV